MKKKIVLLSASAALAIGATSMAVFKFVGADRYPSKAEDDYTILLDNNHQKYDGSADYCIYTKSGNKIKMNEDHYLYSQNDMWASTFCTDTDNGHFEFANPEGTIHGLTEIKMVIMGDFTIYYGHEFKRNPYTIEKTFSQSYDFGVYTSQTFDFNGTLPNYIRFEGNKKEPVYIKSLELHYSCNLNTDLKTIHIEKEPEDGGTVTINGAETKYLNAERGTQVELVARPYQNYQFLGWFRPGMDLPISQETTYTISLSEDKSFFAKFAKEKFTVTLYVEPQTEHGGTVTGAGMYEWGYEVTITATANPGFIFDGWFKRGGDQPVTIDETHTFTMPREDIDFFAHFKNSESR